MSTVGPTQHQANGESEFMASHATEAIGAMEQHPWFWHPYLIVLISSGCIMVIELVAGRIVAPYVGVSLYTWTSIIGVVLAGISLGNLVGGWLADRYASLRLLGSIFALGGLSSFGILAADALGRLTPGEWPIVVEILVLTIALFFVPCVILGAISPVIAKLAVRDLKRTGITVGRLYAAGSLGSIFGTFATGFFLISWFGTHVIVWGVALLLLGLGLLFLLDGRWRWMLLAVLVLAGGTVAAARLGWHRGPCTRETNYFCIKVQELERDGEPVRVLVLDRLVHSYTSLNDPTKLVYGYEQIYAEVAAYRARDDSHLRALFIGGGGYTFPRYMESVYPGSDIHVIEIDPGVTQIAHDLLGLDRDTRVVSYNRDARIHLRQEPSGRYDLILGDAFNDFSVPYHLTTREFNERVRAWLEEDGLYVVNIVDGPRGDFLRAYTYTLQQTFRYVYLAPTIESWRESSRSTFVLIGSDVPLDEAALWVTDAGDDVPLLARRMLGEGEMEALLTGERILLTDRHAPVDQMLTPVFRGEVSR